MVITEFISTMKNLGISSVFHYVPLHSSAFSGISGFPVGDLPVTDSLSERLVRLPFWIGLEGHQNML